MKRLLILLFCLSCLPGSAYCGLFHPLTDRKTCKENHIKAETAYAKRMQAEEAYNKAHPQPQVIYVNQGNSYNPALNYLLFNQLQHNAYNQFQNFYPTALPWNNPYSNYR